VRARAAALLRRKRMQCGGTRAHFAAIYR